MCDVCCEYFLEKDFSSLPKCKMHSFCVNCTVEHIEEAVKQMQREIRCMHDGCPNLFNIKRLEELKISEAIVDKFKQID